MNALQNKNPLVSVLMSCFNVEEFVSEAVESLLRQSYRNIEYIFIDDGSSDQTLAILSAFDDKRIHLISHQNIGIVGSLNKGLKKCSGKYIARMDADDISHLDRVEKQVAFMESHPEVAAVGGAINEFDENGVVKSTSKPTRHIDLLFFSLTRAPISNPTSMIRREVLINNNLDYNSKYKYSQDVKLWADLIRYGELANLQDTLLEYRKTASQVTTKHRTEQKGLAEEARREVYQYLQKSMWSYDNLELKHVWQFLVYAIRNAKEKRLIEKVMILLTALGRFARYKISRVRFWN